MSHKYRLVIVGAGSCTRIFEQLEPFPIDVIGNYGMQVARYNSQKKTLDIIEKDTVPYRTFILVRSYFSEMIMGWEEMMKASIFRKSVL